MNFFKKKTTRRIILVCIALLLIIGACGVYLRDYYRADTAAIEAFSPGTVSVERTENNTLLFLPETAEAGFIFYPGGKVEYTAYIPLMEQLASRGILCALVEMPFHLAVLDMDAAAGIPEQYPRIEHWYIGGHSLGGAMAASYLSGCPKEFEGLVLLGAYSTADLSQTGLSLLSLYGSEDGVMDREKYEKYRENLPEDFEEIILEGGCHAYFGMYGAQDGDGIPTVTNEDQILFTADAIAAMIAESRS